MHNREKFLRLLRGVAVRLPTPWLVRLSGQRLLVPVYHLVSDAPVPHVQHLYPIKTVAAFRQDLEFLLKHYQPIDLPTLQGLVQRGQQPAHNALLLTFDDGLREFHDVIAPILQARGVPAVCFLNSAFVDNQALFYRYKASLLVEALATNPRLAQTPATQAWLAAHAAPGQALRAAVLGISYQHQTALDELGTVLEVDFADYLRTQQPYLTISQIRTLQGQGFHFGGHSTDHPEYQFITLVEQLHQTRESVATVAATFGLNYRTFAFPFTDYGVSADFFQQLYPPAQPPELDISFGCAGLKHEQWPRHVQRVPLETQGRSAQEIMNTEYLYFLLKALLGKNTIHRPWLAPFA